MCDKQCVAPWAMVVFVTTCLTTWFAAAGASAQVRISSEAYAGQPFGVGRIAVELPDAMLPEVLGADGLGISERQGRALYPVHDASALRAVAKQVLDATPLLSGGPVRQEVRGILRGILDRPGPRSIFFLFTGDEPLELTLQARSPRTVQVNVADNPAAHRRLLEAWWREYAAPPGLFATRPDYTPVVETYLKATLARRLNLRLPVREQTPSPRDLLRREVAMLSGAESVLCAMQQDRLLGLHELSRPADQPLPEPIAPPPLALVVPDGVEVEPIALRVPAECFYVRFGEFQNLLWMQDTLARWGGDLQNLVAARGVSYGLSQQIERQLVVEQTAMSRLLGDKIIGDVALVGTDLFFREGAAHGMLFEAKQSTLLAADLKRQRLERKLRGATEETVTLGGREVSYLHTPDGQTRSYYVTDGDYHFVTTSRRLAERFIEAAGGQGSLGATDEFRHARSVMPLKRNDTVFIYLSDAFFRNITGPHYRLEMARRLQAQADILCVQLAVMAAAAEGKPADTIEALVEGALLPADFGPRPDGSAARLDQGTVVDSLRGHRGALVPVPDVPIGGATLAEVREYRALTEAYRGEWNRLDPVLVAIRREPIDKGRERVSIDAQFNPFDKTHYELLSAVVGPADERQIRAVPGDIARLEVVLPQQRVFAGLRDVALPNQLADLGSLGLGRLREVLIGYLGTTGEAGILNFLERPLAGPPGPPGPPDPRGLPDSRGPTLGPLGVARQRTGQFTVFSLQPEVLAEVVPQLGFEPAPHPAQLRLAVGDVSASRLAAFANNLSYNRSLGTSLGNLRLIHAIEQQLHVPAKLSKEAAEFLVGAQLVCPLGGKYTLDESATISRWTSTALEGLVRRPGQSASAPTGFESPPLSWFRGLRLDAAMTDQLLRLRAEVDMKLPQ